jgi:hypothetical protein
MTSPNGASPFLYLASGAATIPTPEAVWHKAYRLADQFIEARPFDSRYARHHSRADTNAFGLVGEWAFARFTGYRWDWPAVDQPHGDHSPDVGPYEVKCCGWISSPAFRRLAGGVFSVPAHTEAPLVAVLHLFTYDHRAVYLDGWIGTGDARVIADERNRVPYTALSSWRTMPERPG